MSRSLRHRLLLLVILTASWPRAATGQSEHVVFQHGLGQSASNWNWIINDLEARHPLIGHAINLPDENPYSTQASSLAGSLNSLGYNNIPGVSHSNGGVATREYVRTTGSPRLDGHLALGTPHQGALLAKRLHDGAVGFWAGLILYDLIWPVAYYAYEDPDWDWVNMGGGTSGPIIETVASYLEPVLEYGLPIGGFLYLRYRVSESQFAAVLPDMFPGSSTFTNLNSSSALSSEAQKTPTRVSISSQYPLHLAPWRPLCQGAPTPGARSQCTVDIWLAWSDMIYFAQQAYEYYSFHPDWDLRNNAWRWDQLAQSLLSIPPLWSSWTAQSYDSGDGVVPWQSSDYPGTSAYHEYVTLADGLYVHHMEQLDAVPDHDEDPFRERISEVLEVRFGLAASPPDPPLVVSIGGPSTVQPNDPACNWWASVSGGTGSYQYSWSGVLSGNQATVYGGISGSGTLYLTVTSGSQRKNVQKYISVSASADECFF